MSVVLNEVILPSIAPYLQGNLTMSRYNFDCYDMVGKASTERSEMLLNMHRSTPPQQHIIQSKMSIMPKLRNPELDKANTEILILSNVTQN